MARVFREDEYQEAFDNLRYREASEAAEEFEDERCERCGFVICTCMDDEMWERKEWERQ